jgi:hypothetical protein
VLEDRGARSVRDVGEGRLGSIDRKECGWVRVKAQAYLTAALVDERREPVGEGGRTSRP